MLAVYISLLVILAAILGFIIWFSYFQLTVKTFKEIFARPEPMPRVDRSPSKIDQKTVFGRGKNWFYTTRNEYIDVRINSFDKVPLAGYFRPSRDRNARFAVILLHAYNEHPTESAAYARLMMHQIECHVLITHLRAHQMSGGKKCTYGLYESVDLSRWIEFLKKQCGEDVKIFVVGRGIGATAALLAAQQPEFSNNVAGIIADCPLDSLPEVLNREGQKRYPFGTSVVLKSIDKMAQEKLRASIYRCDVLPGAGAIKVPVLFLCAGDDDVTTPHQVRAIYDDIRVQKRLITVDHAKHLMCYDKAPSTIEKEIRQFVEQCVVRLVSIGRM